MAFLLNFFGLSQIELDSQKIFQIFIEIASPDLGLLTSIWDTQYLSYYYMINESWVKQVWK